MFSNIINIHINIENAKLSLVKFLSNENGTITGYVLNTPMVKNLVFKKISSIIYEK